MTRKQNVCSEINFIMECSRTFHLQSPISPFYVKNYIYITLYIIHLFGWFPISTINNLLKRRQSCGKPQEAYHPWHNLSWWGGVPQSWLGRGTPVLARTGYPLSGTGVPPTCDWGTPCLGLGYPFQKDMGTVEVLWDGDGVPSLCGEQTENITPPPPHIVLCMQTVISGLAKEALIWGYLPPHTKDGEGNVFTSSVHRGVYPSLWSLVLSGEIPQSLIPSPFWREVLQSLVPGSLGGEGYSWMAPRGTPSQDRGTTLPPPNRK